MLSTAATAKRLLSNPLIVRDFPLFTCFESRFVHRAITFAQRDETPCSRRCFSIAGFDLFIQRHGNVRAFKSCVDRLARTIEHAFDTLGKRLVARQV